MTDIKPGLYRGVSYEEYASWPCVRHSDLVNFNRTPAHAREFMLHPKESTESMEFGRAYHSAILEPDKFLKEFVAVPKVDRRTKEGKALWREFEAEHGDKTLLTEPVFEQLVGMRTRMWSHPTANELLSAKGESEVCIVWKDEETGLKCKARIDRVTAYGGYPMLLDLKTTDKDASERAFQSTMARYGYHQQAGMYLDGMEALFPGPHRKFTFVVQEKVRPFEPGCYELDDVAVAQGRSQFHKHLRRLKECVETGNWPGHGDGIGLVGIPQWAMNQEDLVG